MASLLSRTHDPVGSLSIYHTVIFVRYNELERVVKVIQSLPIRIKHLKINPVQNGLSVSFTEEGSGHASPMFAINQAGLMD